MLVSVTAGIDLSAYATGWLDNVQNIELNTTYDESCDPTDYYLDYYYYDAFKFNLGMIGTINLYIESKNNLFFVSHSYPTFYYIYDANDTSNYLYKFSEGAYYDSGRGIYSLSENSTLPKGSYYLFAKYYHYGHEGTYNFSLNFQPNICKPSNFKVSTRNTTSLKLSWSKVGGVSGYQIQQYKSNKWRTIKNTTSNSCTVSSLKAGTTYKFRVRSYKTVNGKKYYSAWSKVQSIKCK